MNPCLLSYEAPYAVLKALLMYLSALGGPTIGQAVDASADP